MPSYLLPENEPWLELAVVLAVGTVVIAGFAALTDRFVRSAIWKRTVWQVATLGLLVLMVVELTGTAPALVRLWRARVAAATDLAWLDAADLDRHDAQRGGLYVRMPYPPTAVAFFPATDQHARENETWDISQQVIAPDEQPASTYPSMPEEAGAATSKKGATGGLPPSAGSEVPGETLADEPPVAHAFWWLGLVWAFGAVVIVAWTVSVRTLLSALWRRRTAVSDGPLCERVATFARRLGIRRRVRVLEAAGLRAPVAFGSIRPTVAVPVTFANDFDRQQQGAVLAHELAHLAARDPAWQVLAGLLCAALWWHPLAWWSRHKLHAASEAAADEASLLVPDGPDLLAACLVAMGRRLAPPHHLGWLSFEGPGFRSSLGRRVERLWNLRSRSWRAPGRGRLLLVKSSLPVAVVIVAVCCTAWARPQATLTEGGTTMQVLRTSWRQSLAAAALTLFIAGCSDAVADDPPIEESLPAVTGSDFSDAEGQLALLAEGEEGEAREREEREHEEGEAREHEERERREVEEREGRRREVEERERREVHERDRRAVEREQSRVIDLTVELHQLIEKARQIKRKLEGLRDDQDAEARELQGALRETQERMRDIQRELRGPEREREPRELRAEERAELEAHLRELMRRRRELGERAGAIKRELGGLRDDQDEEARRLQEMFREARAAAERVEGEIREVSQRLGRRPDRPRPERPRPDRPRPDRPRPEREQLMRHLEELKALIGRLEEAGRHEEAEAREREAREIVRELEGRPERPRHEAPEDLRRELHELRGEVNELRREIQSLRQMLQRLLGRGREEGDRRDVPRLRREEGDRREGPRLGREEGERRNVPRHDRQEGERRDVDRRDREEGERRDVERRDREKGEPREREEQEREEGESGEAELGPQGRLRNASHSPA